MAPFYADHEAFASIQDDDSREILSPTAEPTRTALADHRIELVWRFSLQQGRRYQLYAGALECDAPLVEFFTSP
jgi:hypothetical protein